MTRGLPCAVCAFPIHRDTRVAAMCWMDPGGEPCVAHTSCLVRLGEFELGLDLLGCRPAPDRPGPAP